MADDKRRPSALKLSPSRSSISSSSSDSLKHPRTPRFAEATSVHSPVEHAGFFAANPAQPGDMGFGYLDNHAAAADEDGALPRSPLKSAMKVPGTPGRRLDNPLSPTFREEQVLEKQEALTEKEQARDLTIKTRVRMAKFALRGVNFSCSLIILSMLSASFSIFNATKALPAQSSLPAWASNTNAWPQKVVLAAACVSLLISILVFVGYCRGGHQRAEKVSVYYTLFAVGWFIFSMVMWAVAAGVLQVSRNSGNNKDMWGWSCVQNHRSEVFGDKVDYALVCRLQNWALICIIIEIVVEVISITLYSVVFYRYYSKRKLSKSMDLRDKARSDLYLAQLRSQSAPNTPGFAGPQSPAFSQYALSPRFPPQAYRSLGDVAEDDGQAARLPFTPGGRNLVEPTSAFARSASASASDSATSATSSSSPFRLQPAPAKAPSATPKLDTGAFANVSGGPVSAFYFHSPASPAPPTSLSPPPQSPPPQQPLQQSQQPPQQTLHEHGPVAPGEVQYAAVPIPGAYAGAAHQ